MRIDLLEETTKVGIIGAGFAGLRAARYLEQVGIDYQIVEGSGRIGGRVFPFPYQNGYLHHGAEYVNGIDNEIYQLVEKFDLLDKKEGRTKDLWMLDDGTITVTDGKQVDENTLTVWKTFVKEVNEALYEESTNGNEWHKSVADKIDEHFEKFAETRNKEGLETFRHLCRIFKNYFQTEWSSPVHELGMKNLCTWEDGTDEEDSAVLNEFGFKKILEEFESLLPKEKILLNSKVININYGGSENVRLLLDNGKHIYFDTVIVTCSLGFLKRHGKRLFTPSLSLRKQQAIARMGFGSNMKVFLEYQEPWWSPQTSTIMISSDIGGEDSKITDNLMVFQPSSWARNTTKVGIIGAGFAGLRAARYLEQVGIDYQIVEGSGRIGGRVFPFPYQNGYLHHGAEYVNGIDNEIYQLVEKFDLLDKKGGRTKDLWMLDDGTITVTDGKQVDENTLTVWKTFVKEVNEALYEESTKGNEWHKSVADKIDEHFEKFAETRNKEDFETFRHLCRIFKNYFQTEWSSPVHELGMKNLCTWEDGTDEEDSAVLNEFGFKKILEEFESLLPKEKILLNSKVININYGGSENVRLLLDNGKHIYFDTVIVTCSLGFLKRHGKRLFTPSLSLRKQQAIARMGFGSNMKVFLEYQEPWWSPQTSTIMISSDIGGEDSKITDNLMVFQPSSWARNILIAWIADCGPYEVALKTDEDLKRLIDSFLKQNLEKAGVCRVTEATRIFRYDWVEDEFALGSYSYFLSGVGDHDCIETLGEPILKGKRPVVCFAGEHTDPEIYQTTTGAANSGLREAMRIAAYYESPITDLYLNVA